VLFQIHGQESCTSDKVYTKEYECKVLMHYKTHISSSKSDYATACHKNASDQVHVTGSRDLFMSPCLCVCVCVHACVVVCVCVCVCVVVCVQQVSKK